MALAPNQEEDKMGRRPYLAFSDSFTDGTCRFFNTRRNEYFCDSYREGGVVHEGFHEPSLAELLAK